jgi:hypothetical protein
MVAHAGVRPRVVVVATTCALALHLLWFEFLAGSGGDLAAQDAWTAFVLAHPTSAYDFAWYGGMHPASYSVISPFVMGLLGVRATLLVAGTLTTALVTVLIGRLPTVVNPLWAGIYSAVAITGNAISGRATFGLGLALGTAAVAAVFAWPRLPPWRGERWVRGALTGLLAVVATAASPVAGLFLGLLATALWLRRRRAAALALGVGPVLVVAGTAVVFPSAGVQPFAWQTAVVPLLLAGAGWLLLPRRWRLARVGSAVYAAAVVLIWAVPTPIGTNVTRLSLLFGGIILVAAASGSWWTSSLARRLGRWPGRLLLAGAIVTATGWQLVIAGNDVAGSSSASALDVGIQPLVAQLDARGADLGRVEVVPSKSHREASALAPYVNLARGWNRQADVARDPIFYGHDRPLTAERYRRWLRRMAVRFVVLPTSSIDYAGLRERTLIRSGVRFLTPVWSDSTWTLYAVSHPNPLVAPPGSLVSWDDAAITVSMPAAGSTIVRVAWSPWLSIVDVKDQRQDDTALAGACLSSRPSAHDRAISWVTLVAPQAGTYRISAPYELPRGTPCTGG